MAPGPNDPCAPKSFFDLPLEVRELVYLKVLQPQISWDAETGCCRCGESTCMDRHAPLEDLRGCHKLLCLNHQIWSECQPIMNTIPQELEFRRVDLDNGWCIGVRHSNSSLTGGIRRPHIPLSNCMEVQTLRVEMVIERDTSYADFAKFVDLAAAMLEGLRDIRTIYFVIHDLEGFRLRFADLMRPLVHFRVRTVIATLDYRNNSGGPAAILAGLENDTVNLDFLMRRRTLLEKELNH